MPLRSILLAMLAALPLLGRAAAVEPEPAGSVSGDAASYALRARAVDVHTLLSWLAYVSEHKGRSFLVGQDVKGAMSIDLERASVAELQQEIIRKTGADALRLGSTLLVGGPAQQAVVGRSPLLSRLAARNYHGRRVSLVFDRIRLSRLLQLLSGVAKRPVEVGEGVDQQVTLAITDTPWDELLDVVSASGGLVWRYGDVMRFARRDDENPRYAPLDNDAAADPTPAGGLVTQQGCAPPLGNLELGDLTLVAVLTGPREPQALVRVADGRHVQISRGTCVGWGRGRVSQIQLDRVVVEEGGAERALMLEGSGP